MVKAFKILDIFKTSLGHIAILGIYGEAIPYIGMTLTNEEGHAWKIIALGMNKKFIYSDITTDDYSSIWDCTLEPIENNPLLKKSDSLFES